MNIPALTTEQVELFILMFMRVSAIMVTIPVLGGRTVPVRVKAGLSLLIVFLIYPFVQLKAPMGDLAVFPLALRMAGEVLIGVIIGFAGRLIFAGIQLAGQLIGFQMGFAIVNVVDPITSAQVSIIAQLQYLIAVLIFLTINGHHIFLHAISDSYCLLPPLGFHFSGELMETILELSKNLFVVAIKTGAPVIVALLCTSVGLGLIARTVPQINIFIVGFPLKIAVGLIGIGLTLPMFLKVTEFFFFNLKGDVSLLLHHM